MKEEHLPEIYLPFDTKRAEVLYGLYNIDGKTVSKTLVTYLLFENIEELGILGRPAMGKSTILDQISREVERLSTDPQMQDVYNKYLSPIKVTKISFDQHRDRLIHEYGDTMSWTPRIWQELNQNVIADKKAAQQKQHIDPRTGKVCRNLIIYDAVLGSLDRGLTALKQPVGQNMIIGVVGDKRIEDASLILRDFIAFIAYESNDLERFLDLKLKLLTAFNIDVGESYDNSEESGRHIVDLFLKMAQKHHISKIRDEVRQLTDEWFIRKSSISSRMITNVQLPKALSEQPYAKRMQIEAAYMQYLFSYEFNLSPLIATVVFSPFNFNLIHMY